MSWSYGRWIYNYLCNQCLSPLKLWVRIQSRQCDKVCQRLATGRWFSPRNPVSSNNETDLHDSTEILLKVALSTITLSLWNGDPVYFWKYFHHEKDPNKLSILDNWPFSYFFYRYTMTQFTPIAMKNSISTPTCTCGKVHSVQHPVIKSLTCEEWVDGFIRVCSFLCHQMLT